MLALFAQKGQGGAEAAGLAAGVVIFYILLIVVAYTIRGLFLFTIFKCFKEISPRNQQLQPALVWLGMIPLVDLVIAILVIIKLPASLRDEYEDRGMRGDGDYGQTLGIVSLVMLFLCSFIGLIPLIMYWVKIAGYTKQLRARGGGRYDDDDDDDEDDRPRKRRSRDDDEDDDDDRPRRKRRRSDDDDDDE